MMAHHQINTFGGSIHDFAAQCLRKLFYSLLFGRRQPLQKISLLLGHSGSVMGQLPNRSKLFLDDLSQMEGVHSGPEGLIRLHLLPVDRCRVALKLRQSVKRSLRLVIDAADPGALADDLYKLH